MNNFRPSDYEYFDEEDDKIFEKSKKLTDKFRNEDGMPEFKDETEFKQYLQDLFSIGGNRVSPVKSVNPNDPTSPFMMTVRFD